MCDFCLINFLTVCISFVVFGFIIKTFLKAVYGLFLNRINNMHNVLNYKIINKCLVCVIAVSGFTLVTSNHVILDSLGYTKLVGLPS